MVTADVTPQLQQTCDPGAISRRPVCKTLCGDLSYIDTAYRYAYASNRSPFTLPEICSNNCCSLYARMASACREKHQCHNILWLQTPSTTIVAEALSQCRHSNSRWASERSARRLRRSLSWLARQMEQSRLRLLAEFESMRFPDRASCEEMPSGCQPRTPPQAVAPSRPHRLASLWGGLTSRTQSPFAQPAQQARPFDSDTPIYSSKASLATLSKVQQAPAVQVTLVFCPIPFSTYLSMYLRTYLYLQCSYRDVKSRSVQDM